MPIDQDPTGAAGSSADDLVTGQRGRRFSVRTAHRWAASGRLPVVVDGGDHQVRRIDGETTSTS